VKNFIGQALCLCRQYGRVCPRRKEILGMKMWLPGRITQSSGEAFSLGLVWDMVWDWEGKTFGISILAQVEGLCLDEFLCFELEEY